MEQLSKTFEQLNINAGDETISKFQRYMDMVLEANEKVNLTAITDENEFIKKHFVDSVICAGFDEVKNANSIIDVGTGAGFPGVPLALIFPDKDFLLMDSLGKRIKILNEIINELEIKNVRLIHARAEDLARKAGYREGFDVCVSRAVASLSVLSEYCLPFVAVGGSFIAYKGPDAGIELSRAEGAINIFGGELADIRKADIDGFDLDHKLIVIKKRRNTPEKYPRKAGIPARAPI